jgi:hypothetical protein
MSDQSLSADYTLPASTALLVALHHIKEALEVHCSANIGEWITAGTRTGRHPASLHHIATLPPKESHPRELRKSWWHRRHRKTSTTASTKDAA